MSEYRKSRSCNACGSWMTRRVAYNEEGVEWIECDACQSMTVTRPGKETLDVSLREYRRLVKGGHEKWKEEDRTIRYVLASIEKKVDRLIQRDDEWYAENDSDYVTLEDLDPNTIEGPTERSGIEGIEATIEMAKAKPGEVFVKRNSWPLLWECAAGCSKREGGASVPYIVTYSGRPGAWDSKRPGSSSWKIGDYMCANCAAQDFVTVRDIPSAKETDAGLHSFPRAGSVPIVMRQMEEAESRLRRRCYAEGLDFHCLMEDVKWLARTTENNFVEAVEIVERERFKA